MFSGFDASVATIKHAAGKIFTATRDKKMQVFDPRTGGRLHLWDGLTVFLVDGDVVYADTPHRAVVAYDVATGAVLGKMIGHGGVVMMMQHHRGMLYTASVDGTLVSWDVEECEMKRIFVGHEDWVLSVKLLPSKGLLYSGSKDASVREWDMMDGQCTRQFFFDQRHSIFHADVAGDTLFATSVTCLYLVDLAEGVVMGSHPHRENIYTCIVHQGVMYHVHCCCDADCVCGFRWRLLGHNRVPFGLMWLGNRDRDM